MDSIVPLQHRGTAINAGPMRLYQNIGALFESRIADGIYRVGDRLPSVREASRSLGVSLTTIYHAYNVLEFEGAYPRKATIRLFDRKAAPCHFRGWRFRINANRSSGCSCA